MSKLESNRSARSSVPVPCGRARTDRGSATERSECCRSGSRSETGLRPPAGCFSPGRSAQRSQCLNVQHGVGLARETWYEDFEGTCEWKQRKKQPEAILWWADLP